VGTARWARLVVLDLDRFGDRHHRHHGGRLLVGDGKEEDGTRPGSPADPRNSVKDRRCPVAGAKALITRASDWLAGVPVHLVAERLGHADPAITLRVYAHILRQHAAGVADVFAAAIEPDHAVSAAVNDGLAEPGASWRSGVKLAQRCQCSVPA
jgi:integrase